MQYACMPLLMSYTSQTRVFPRFPDASFRTFKMAQDANDSELTPNQRISVLAKKWREERNFWIAAMAFTLWW